MLVSHKHKLVIFTLERTATASIHFALAKYFDVEIDTMLLHIALKHVPAETFDKLIKPFLPDEYYKIAVVREPVSRLVSLCNITHKNNLQFSDWWIKHRNDPWVHQTNQLSVDDKLYIDRLFDFNRLDLFCDFLSSILKEDIKLPVFGKSKSGDIQLPTQTVNDITTQLHDDVALYKSIVDAGGKLIINPYRSTP